MKCTDFSNSLRRYYVELKKYPPISREKEMKLMKMAKKGNTRAQNEIIKANLRFVFDVAKSYSGKGANMEDLICEGNIALLKAMEKFDITKGVKFYSYAVWWVKEYMSSFIKTRQEIIITETSDEDFKDSIIEKSVADSEDDNMTKIEIILPENENFNGSYDNNEYNKLKIDKLLNKLDEREKSVIESYFGVNGKKEENLIEISKKMKLSTERVRQIKIKAMRIMRTEALMYSK